MFQAIADGVADALLLVDGQGRIAAWNNAAIRVFDYGPHGLQGAICTQLFSAETVRRLQEEGAGAHGSLLGLRRDGEPFPVDVSLKALPDSEMTVWAIRDLSDAHDAMMLLQGAYERLERAHREWVSAFDAVRDPIFLHDAEGRIVKANRAYAERAGLPVTELRGRRYWELFPKGEGPLPNCMHAVEGDDDKAVDEVEHEGSVFLSRAFVARSGDGGYTCSVHILEDVTGQRRMERQLRAREARLSAIFEAARDVSLIMTDLRGEDSRIVEFSPGAEHIFGHRRDEVIGRPVAMLHRPEDVARFPEAIEAMRQHRDGFSGETVLVRKGGEEFPAIFTTYPVTGDHGEMVGTLGVSLDITDRKRTESALRLSEGRLAQAQRIAHLGHWVWEIGSGDLTWSDEVFRIFGSEPGAYPPTYAAFLAHVHPDDVGLVESRVTTALRELSTYDTEHRVVRPDGSVRWVHEQGEVFADAEGRPIRMFGTVLDITERIRTQERLETLGRLYSVLSEVNKAIVRITDRDELFTQVCRIIVVHGGLRMAWVGLYDEAENAIVPVGHYGHEEGYLDGFRIELTDSEQVAGPSAQSFSTRSSIICQDIATDPRMAHWRDAALARNYRSNAGFAFDDGDGTRGTILLYSDRPHFFGPEVVGLFTGLADDFSYALNALANRRRREQAERALSALNTELEERVRSRTTELEAVNRELESFSYSVSHDLRAPLRAIDGFSRLLLNRYADGLDPTAQDYLRRVRAATERMADIIDDLLMLSRVTRAQIGFDTVDLSALAREVVEELAAAEPDRKMAVEIADAITARGDRRLLQIALENLLGNAWKFTSRTAAARVAFGAETHGGETVYFVADNGAGFNMAYVNKLFGAFQRLHTVDEFPGTGIGLATVQRIVHRHGGRIWAEAAPDRGACFRFTLGGESMAARRTNETTDDGRNDDEKTATAG